MLNSRQFTTGERTAVRRPTFQPHLNAATSVKKQIGKTHQVSVGKTGWHNKRIATKSIINYVILSKPRKILKTKQ